MLVVLYVLLGLSLLAVVFTLLMGGKEMVSTKSGDRSASNKWMWRRVWAQVTAVLLLVITVWYRSNSG